MKIPCIHKRLTCLTCRWIDGMSEIAYTLAEPERQAEKYRQEHSKFMDEYERSIPPGGERLQRVGGLKNGWWIEYPK